MGTQSTCDQRGEPHKVDSLELQEAREHGGFVVCQECGKRVEQGPRNLEFRAQITDA